MSATDSSRTSHLLIAAWSVSALVGIVMMYLLPGSETIPFHLVWIGLSLVYGFTVWRPFAMLMTLAAVTVSTGYVLAHHAELGEIGWEETTEVPLMSMLFAVMVWHVYRRQQALAQVARLADAERRGAERRQLFVRFASHELRTPITVARGYVELVRNTVEPAAQEDLAIVIEELDKLAGISQRLITLMQVDDPYPRHVRDVDAELSRIVRRWEPAAPRSWSVRSCVGLMPVNAERLEAALDCLLENAVKFTDPGDRIEVTGYTRPGAWVVEVADSGIGVTVEQARALTSGAVRLTRTTTGSGLGLAIARAVVEGWGGGLVVTGEPGAGTTVALWIPESSGNAAEGLPVPATRMTT
ncbi:HAMP domain-containing sensor histidine kinase [Streptosporangium sp. NPDC051023]|uniref:sensor histidine kinase n=1 Tax=Streptosporangium sp. NPDC051023 TaxID=3155410 RepID=UPI00344E097E